MDQPTQDAMFAAVAKKYCTEPLFIKTHPRDTTDYSKLFPTAVILPRTMPSEVLNFCPVSYTHLTKPPATTSAKPAPPLPPVHR